MDTAGQGTGDMTGREDFVVSWLCEMPQGMGRFETFAQIEHDIRERLATGGKPINVAGDISKLVGPQVVYYWIEQDGEIALGVELQVKPQALVVALTGKNPKWMGKPPYASDLYNAILRDNDRSLRLYSDEFLSDEGYAIWQKLLDQGHRISVYDKQQPGASFKTIDSADDLARYFKHGDPDFKRYQYVLSESSVAFLDTRSLFSLRRYREVVGLL